MLATDHNKAANPNKRTAAMIALNLHDAITALSTSFDFVGIDEVQHGKRVGYMARAVAHHLGWSDERCWKILHAGMLHDCGVSRVREHRHLTETLEWDGEEEHCIRGANYLRVCPILAHFTDIVRYHHTRWAVLEQMVELDPVLRLEANLVYLVDRADVLLAPWLDGGRLDSAIMWEKDAIVERLRGLAGTLFCPALVDAFAAVAESEAFWLGMEPLYLNEEMEALGRQIPALCLSPAEMRELALLFSRVVDAKSPYTDDHSRRVAAISRHLAGALGRDRDTLEMIELAGLLHDMGKLRVPDEIIEKPGALTREEKACISRHSYDTYRILARIFPSTPIPDWAGAHHENLLGQGYPFRRRAGEIDLETRIISVADIFQALLQDRPYRARLSGEEVMQRIEALVDEGRLDAAVVSALRREFDTCVHLASGADALRDHFPELTA